MDSFITLQADDGHRFQCWQAPARTAPRGAVVVLQEIFGVNAHIRAVCVRLAHLGYDALAPALFDRVERDFQTGYATDDLSRALALMPRLDWPAMVRDTLTAVRHAAQGGRPVAAMGFCLGASVAYLAGQQSDALSAVVGYYGGQIADHLDAPPRCPTLLHYGERDHTIPMTRVERIRAGRPECELHVYPAGHGFNCDDRAAFEPASAALAWQRSTQWLRAHLG